MKYALDTEFLDLPAQFEGTAIIDLLSIGIVREDGDELHVAIQKPRGWWDKREASWLRDNVLPHLPEPIRAPEARHAITSFILAGSDPEFYAYVGAYDWVALMSLFGPLISRNHGWPMSFVELKTPMIQYSMSYGVPPRIMFPREDGPEHSAVDDARWNMSVMRKLGIV